MEEKLWDKILAKLPEESLQKLDGLDETTVSPEKIKAILASSGLNFDEIIKEIQGA